MATTYDKASLVMIPSGYKDDKLYSIKPTDGSGDFTFSRDGAGASPATRVNASGLIEKGRENLLTYSNDFSNAAWVKSSAGTGTAASVTSGFSDPDGGSNAWRLQCDLNGGTTSGDQSLIYQLGSSTGVFAFSYYVKSNTGADQNFAFGNGLSGGNFETAVATTSWQRFDAFFNCTANNNSFIGARGTMGTDDTLDILIYAAQVESGLVATAPAIETTTAPVSAGLLGDMPRLDYSGGATCPSLLLEPSRVNIHTNSEYLDAYVKSRSTITSNAATSPEGVSNASKIIPLSTSTGWAGVNAPNYSFTSGDTYTLSVFAKAGEYNYCQVGGSTPAFNGSFATINLTNGVVEYESGITATTEDYGNGWWRIYFTHTAIATASSPIGFLAVYSTAVSSRLVTQVGDDVSGIYAWGWSAELGSYPTSYIPTYGSASTRGAEGGQITSVSDLIGQTEGTLYAEVDSFGDGEVANRIFGISNGTDDERVIMLTRSYGFRFIMTNSSSNNVDYTYSVNTDGRHKVAMTYNATEVRIYVDGELRTTDSSVVLPSSLNSAYLGKAEQNGVYTNNFGGSAKQALVFKTALTDAECIALTTL